jgi:hypothetical protein
MTNEYEFGAVAIQALEKRVAALEFTVEVYRKELFRLRATVDDRKLRTEFRRARYVARIRRAIEIVARRVRGKR